MIKSVLKTKSVISVLLVFALLSISVSLIDFGADDVITNTHTSRNKMVFSTGDFTATFFLSEKVNQFRESHFAETKSRRQRISFENHIESLQTTINRNPFINCEITIFPFYVILCVLIVQMIIKYIYNKDGKKRTSYFYNKY